VETTVCLNVSLLGSLNLPWVVLREEKEFYHVIGL
jgi:hypothetical protein